MLRSRPTSYVLAAILLASLACRPPQPPPPEILWDEWGVPHIFADDLEGLFYAHGWAQAKNHGDLVLRLYGEARGRAAEYWGESHLDGDRWVRKVGVPERAAAWTEAQAPEVRAALDAFARGINDYAVEHPEAIDDEVEVVLPVSAADVLAHVQRSIHFTFIVGPDAVKGFAKRWSAGSNAWAVSPARTASGHAMLVANPHLPWSDLFTWFEVQLVTGDVDLSGAALVGHPFVGIGWNDHLGWTHTVNTHDGADLYELVLEGDGYRFGDEVRPFEVEHQTLRVRGEDGTLRDEELEVKRSVHGPVVAEKDGKALALRVVGLEASGIFEQYWAMAGAKDLAEFEAAQAMLQMPMFTTMYADADGHVMHVFGGRTPVRSEGDWSFWTKVVPGDRPELLWTETHPYADLPKVIDPPSGWLQNANDPPWTTTFPQALDADDFPAYMAPRFMHFRAQSSARLLMADVDLTFDELVTAKHSTKMELADRVLDDLARAVESHGSEKAYQSLDVLQAWDRRADAESRGAVLFAAFADELRGGVEFAEKWQEDDPLDTPDGFGDPAAAVAALERAAAQVEARHGALDVAWGEVYRLRRGGHDLPANGGPGGYGIFRVLNYREAEDGKLVAFAGDSYVAVVEFSDPPRAATLLSYGNASQPGSSHVGDQLELFARQELRPAWRTRDEILDHLEARETLTP